ncbi:sigma-70 family RNA polymerase sigma factor [Clostridioides difficile]|uniref:Sigma-70 family RNA polymerase sigma factor n=1 Tax=Clostridioides difficile TaxID=1496 RepID=A0A9P3WVH5_CLODI|nr:sigma-70 family RNA polymerase sigma factor [Clostridioides difficile]AWH78844.1 RNA polymerase subunit sigma-70 [Clostridioides difficile]AWH82669.1 RNA polymerase subunit sigma-70 [Clostridioides difficile]AXU47779.1 LuxR family transcriptional regulator [Clostridioides difficile]EGT2216439.1 sigma-70 family RNA polymerase sigma factor [Clostridioides difficile]EGT3891490.1 sigma-70 family RNA polymerase sigma factor [Clostridioides difficile]
MYEVELMELIDKSKDGNESAFESLLKIFDKDIQINANKYVNLLQGGFDYNDLIQVARIALWKALSNYSHTKGKLHPKAYFKKAIKLSMLSLLNSGNRKKHRTLNKSISLNNFISKDEQIELITLIDNNEDDIESQVISKEITRELKNKVKKDIVYQTDMQRKVISLRVDGYEGREIERILGISLKSINCHLYRARKIIKQNLGSVNYEA